MRIAVLKESLCIGGTERSAANISRILAEKHQVYMVVYDGSTAVYPYGGKLVDLKIPPACTPASKIISNIRRIFRYNQFIRKERIDVLFEFLSINTPLMYIAHKAQRRLISSRDFGALSRIPKRYYLALKNADGIVFNSSYARKFFCTRYPSEVKKCFTLYNIIDTKGIQDAAAEETEDAFDKFVSSHSHIIVSVGRFCKEKGFEYLLHALANVIAEDSRVGLVLIGDGELRPEYDKIIENLNLKSHVYFTGFQKNPYKYMKYGSCYVLSSLSEGFPNVLAEAMALGLPVIADNCFSGPAEILREDQDYGAVGEKAIDCDYGVLTPSLNGKDSSPAIRELSRAMIDMLKDKEKRVYYSQKSLQRVKAFSAEAAQEKLEIIFSQLRGQA